MRPSLIYILVEYGVFTLKFEPTGIIVNKLVDNYCGCRMLFSFNLSFLFIIETEIK